MRHLILILALALCAPATAGTSINQLSTTSSLATGDLLAVWSSANSDTRKASLTTLLAFISANLTAAGDGRVTQYAAPSASPFTVTVAPVVSGTSVFLLVTPTGVMATGTIVLPSAALAVDRQEVMVTCTQNVTSLTVSAGGTTVTGAPTALVAATSGWFRMRFDAVTVAWYRVS